MRYMGWSGVHNEQLRDFLQTGERVADHLSAPCTLLLGEYDSGDRLQYVGRTTPLARAAGTAVAGLLAAGRPRHPWTGWTFSAGWGSRRS